MCRIRHLFLLIAISNLFAGCAFAATPSLKEDYPEKRAQIQRRLKEIFDAAEKKDLNRSDGYHAYGPKFTKFAVGQLGRQDAIAARNAEHDRLGVINDLSMRADDLKIDVFGDVGVAAFVLAYSFRAGTDTIESKECSTMVFVKERGAWKIVHEHFSPFKSNPR
jgi:ketosteroid isomerase-like protein